MTSEQQGEPVNFMQVEGDVDPSLRSTTVSSTQGEPVCARCGHAEGEHFEGQEMDLDGRPTSPPYPYCYECQVDDRDGSSHPFESAHPSSEEAEVRWERMEESPDYVVWRKRWREGYSESTTIPLDVEAAIRRPVEEQMEFWRQETWAAMETRDSYLARADAAEAQVASLTEERDRALDERDEHAIWANEMSVQVAKLREALKRARHELVEPSPSSRPADLRAITVIERALAETSERDGS